MSLTVAELRATYSVDESALDRSLAGIPRRVNGIRPADVRIGADTTEVDKATTGVERAVQRVQDRLKSAATTITAYFALDKVREFITGSIAAASDLNETINKSNVIFGKNAGEINKWASNSERALGMSKQAALETASGFGDMFRQIGYSGDQAAKLSQRVTQMAADLGSFNNLPTADVVDMISGAFRGEYDSLQRLIPNISAARVQSEAMALSGVRNANALTAQQKAAAVLAIIQHDGARAMGDFARTADQNANSQKILSAAWEDAQAQLGAFLLGPLTATVHFMTGAAIPAFSAVAHVVETMIGWFVQLPAPVKIAVGALAAVALLKGPVSTMFQTIALNARIAMISMEGATFSMATLKAVGTGLMGFFGGPWGLAIVGVTVGLSLLVSWLGSSDAATNKLTDATHSYAQALEESNGAIDANVRKAAAKAAQDAGLLASADKLGISLSDVTDAITRQGAPLDGLRAKLQDIIYAHTQFSASGQYATATMDGTAKQAQSLLTGLDALAGTTGKTQTKEQQLARATKESGDSADAAKAQQESLTDQLSKASDAASKAKQATDLYKLSLDLLTGKTVDLNTVQAAFYDAVAQADGALKDLKGTVLDTSGNLNVQSEAGRKAQDVLFGVRDAGNQLIATMIQQGGTSAQVTAQDAKLRASFYQTALQLTGSKDAAKRLTDQIYGIPAQRTTRITADTAQATAAAVALRNLIASIHDRAVTITTRSVMVGDFNGPASGSGRMGTFAFGGYTGNAPRDRITGLVHGREFVVDADKTARYRPLLEAMQAGTLSQLGNFQAASMLTARQPAGVVQTRQPSAPGPATGRGYDSLVHAEQVNIIEGSVDDLARRLAVEARTAVGA